MAKRTIENCSMHKRAKKEEIGQCETDNGKCIGYAGADGDEPHITCQECKLNVCYEDELSEPQKEHLEKLVRTANSNLFLKYK